MIINQASETSQLTFGELFAVNLYVLAYDITSPQARI
jgi:hypothetical protein